MRPTIAALLLLVAVSLGLQANPLSFAVDTSQSLYSVDLATATGTFIGDVAFTLGGLALSPTGQLYGTDNSGNLYSVDPFTASATLIASTGLGDIQGLVFVAGQLLGITTANTPTLYSIDTTTANPTAVVTASVATGTTTAMTVADVNDVYLAASGGTLLDLLNLSTGLVTVIGNLPSTTSALGLQADGNLYSLDHAGVAWLINQTNAVGTPIGTTGANFWLDMTTSNVPEPGSLTFLAAGMFLIIVRRLERKNKV